MDKELYSRLTQESMANEPLSKEVAVQILTSEDVDLLPLLNAAYDVRKKFFGKDITIHVINNVQNGKCSEDCKYCVQSTGASAQIDEYPMKSDEQIMSEARQAYESGAHRYCMVFSGKSPSLDRVQQLSKLIRRIKSTYSIQVCVSHGFLDKEKAEILKKAGLDRFNHNLNTSKRFYPDICTTHDYEDRIKTLQNAHESDVKVCSGVIVGMGETAEDIYNIACSLRALKVESIPINFYLPIEGVPLDIKPDLSSEYCLKVLCLFRFINPDAEIRLAAGREVYLKSMQFLAFYPANSLFVNGYLNTSGESKLETYKQIKDAGFSIVSEFSLDELIEREKQLEADSVLNNNETPQYIMKFITQRKYIGRMSDPDGSAHIKGPCGDEMEFYLAINDDIVRDIKFHTSGCYFTYACGVMASHLVCGRTIREALQLSPGQIIKELICLPKDHCHCAILTVSTLYKAIADYWLKNY
ncbi:MAG: biotin synthase BioB [Candidatus Omnitrophica bacterium]|nr:biotin synthase BioB [Candidatus Omnitrophota bacterium]